MCVRFVVGSPELVSAAAIVVVVIVFDSHGRKTPSRFARTVVVSDPWTQDVRVGRRTAVRLRL